MQFTSNVLIVPGLGNSGEGHWQTLWEQQYPSFQRVNQRDWDTPVCSDWVEQIDRAVLTAGSSNVLLVGHSLACATIVFWAQAHQRPIKGAFLVAPSDTEAATYPTGTTGFAPVPLLKLPFPSIVVASTNDYYVTLERATFFADAWGSQFIQLGEAGHINVGAGYGDWPEGLRLLKTLD
ncbi:RBBP9/YdeN family alpha/beta hydrolase [Larkinella sp. VNQ87]|uniref:RBBP9/YdeN family alpha/beta hydrolase n=1 Tax=Larkinella sp. VNQ87 TaxID=3400921 RepID=UPI003C0A7CB9